MPVRLRLGCAVAAFIAGFGGSSSPAEEPCKNHYILRPQCAPEELALRWEILPDPPVPALFGHSATLLEDGRVLVVGGARTTYDPETRANRPSFAGAHLFDPSTGTWETTGPMNADRAHHGAVRLLDGRVLVIGGDGYSGLDGLRGSAELFDPATSTWSEAANHAVPRAGFTATLLDDGRVLIAGGVDHYDATLGSTELYDPAADRWRFAGELREPRLVHAATKLADGRVLVVGGMTDDFFMYSTGSAEAFDPATESWSRVGSVAPRWLHSLTRGESGEVVVAGGYTDHPPAGGRGYYSAEDVATTSIFDPGTDTWRSAGSLALKRFRHLALPLRGRGVLLVGGLRSAAPIPAYRAEAVERFELLSLADERWRVSSEANGLPVSTGSFGSATELLDGSVLFLGDLPGAQAVRLRY